MRNCDCGGPDCRRENCSGREHLAERGRKSAARYHLGVHDMKPGERFDPAGLYINDGGHVCCGAHVGTEATYTPWAWSCIGPGPSIEIDGVLYRCEIPHSAVFVADPSSQALPPIRPAAAEGEVRCGCGLTCSERLAHGSVLDWTRCALAASLKREAELRKIAGRPTGEGTV